MNRSAWFLRAVGTKFSPSALSYKRPFSSTPSYSTQSSANPEEIAKFSAMSAAWWDPHGAFSLLHLMNPERIRYIRNQVLRDVPERIPREPPFEGLRVLDIGCGGGLLSESLARLGAQVVGADASKENIEMAKLHYRTDPGLSSGPGSIEYRHTTAESLLEEGERFDFVCAMEVIEHVDYPAEFLETCAGLVKPKGHLILSTMSRTPFAWLTTIFMAERILGLVPSGTHDYNKYIRPEELVEAVKALPGWILRDVRGIGFDPIQRRWFSSATFPPAGLANYFLTAQKFD
ncbi:uncharacterized protein VTP21DRAFT_7291 [Calcarisporiella thermophila]|uniref:uncharacterized protein n=1 Tax=Calcarisporiella thermophila TaxID=911321 RepID=UPI0037448FD1